MPMKNFIALAELKALGVCPSRIYCLGTIGGIRACAHAKLYCFGGNEGIGGVPMQNFIALVELKAMGVCPYQIAFLWQN